MACVDFQSLRAKSHAFDTAGNEVRTDFLTMMRLVTFAGYHGWVGVEYEGNAIGEREGILATKKLLDRVRTQLAA